LNNNTSWKINVWFKNLKKITLNYSYCRLRKRKKEPSKDARRIGGRNTLNDPAIYYY